MASTLGVCWGEIGAERSVSPCAAGAQRVTAAAGAEAADSEAVGENDRGEKEEVVAGWQQQQL